ncbi:MAG: hypothetical protein ACPIOQ_31775 [Promethearchaeia archaeon]
MHARRRAAADHRMDAAIGHKQGVTITSPTLAHALFNQMTQCVFVLCMLKTSAAANDPASTPRHC